MLSNLKSNISYILFIIKMRLKVRFTPTQYINTQIGNHQIGDKVTLMKFLNNRYCGVPEFLVKNANGNHNSVWIGFVGRKKYKLKL